MKILFRQIDDKKELLHHFTDIAELFKRCFYRELSFDLWKWAYLDNPLDTPIVNLAFLDNKLIGHFALMPLATTKYKTLLAITAMVTKESRHFGVFFSLVSQSYTSAINKGYDLIIAFPNKNSAPIYRGFFKWSFYNTFIAQIKGMQLSKLVPPPPTLDEIAIDLTHQHFLTWRLKKPHTTYTFASYNIFKPYSESETDCIVLRETSGIYPDATYNFLTQNKELEKLKLFDYPFAYKILNPSIKNVNFFIEPLMSDVF